MVRTCKHPCSSY